MKVLKVVSVLFVMIVSLLSIACTTNVEPIDPAVLNPNIDPNAPVEGTFKVDFEDQTFSTLSASALIAPNSITIGALKASTGENFTITLTGVTLGEYSTTDQVSILYKEEKAGVFGYLSKNTIGSTATVNITSINNATRRIKGTFKFIGNWNDPTNTTPPAAIQFTNGTFDVPFTTPDAPSTSFFKVDFNGQTFNAITKTAVIGNGKIEIAGIRGTNSETVGITIQGTAAGTYTTTSVMGYSDNTMVDHAYSSLKLEGSTLVNNATVIITNINTTTKIITGTFNFIGYWSDFSNTTPPTPIDFTNGSFSLPYTDAVVNPNPVNGSFTANIDGQSFVANEIIAVRKTIIEPGIPAFTSYNIAGMLNEGLNSKSITIQFFPHDTSSYLIPEEALISYIPNALTQEVYTPTNIANPFENTGVVNITAEDIVNKKISGTFSCTVFLIDNLTQTIIGQKELTNGVFTNVTYTIE